MPWGQNLRYSVPTNAQVIFLPITKLIMSDQHTIEIIISLSFFIIVLLLLFIGLADFERIHGTVESNDLFRRTTIL